MIAADFAPPPDARSLAARLAERWRLWREHRRWVGEMYDAATLGRLDDMLSDVAMSRADLDMLIEAPIDAGRQFQQLAAMEDVDLRQLPPEIVRDAEWKCIRCDCRVACKRWLRTGVWQHDGDPRCPNAALLHH